MIIDGDVDSVIQLKADIRASLLSINQIITAMRGQLNQMGNCWRDEEYHDFNDIMLKLMVSVTNHVDDLADLIKMLDAYEEILNSESVSDDAKDAGQRDTFILGNALEQPHFYTQTQEVWNQTADGMIYDSPVKMRSVLDLNQGKVKRFLGTCGICSCVNVLRLAGVLSITEEKVVKYASKNKLCNYRRFGSKERNGGTGAEDRQKILKNYGVDTFKMPATVDNIAQAVSEGRGVIVSVHAYRLWYNRRSATDFHAVTVTSVKKDFAGNIIGFYIADSGIHNKDGEGYYTKELFEKALTGRELNVTSQIIR